MTSTSGGTNHSGIDTSRATSAATVAHKPPNTDPRADPPCLRSSVAKRRSQTSFSIDGVIITATISSANTTMTGVATKTTSNGASTSFKPPRPMPSSHDNRLPTMA